MLTDKGVSTYIWHVTCIYTCVLCTSPIVCLVQDVHRDNVYFVLQSYPATLLLPQWLHHESCREASSTRREEVLGYCVLLWLIDRFIQRGQIMIMWKYLVHHFDFVVFALCGACIWYITACKGLPHNGLHSFSYSLPTVGVCRIHEVMCLHFPFSLEGTCRSQVYL